MNIATTSTGSSSREISDKTIELLTEGFVNIYHPPLKPLKSQLLEIVKKQESLCDELHRENLKLSEAIYSSELHEMFDKIKLYKQKLVNIKKDMMAIHEQVSRSKKRALKLQQQKQKLALERVQRREYEEHLIQKPPKQQN